MLAVIVVDDVFLEIRIKEFVGRKAYVAISAVDFTVPVSLVAALIDWALSPFARGPFVERARSTLNIIVNFTGKKMTQIDFSLYLIIFLPAVVEDI